jgi:hypothetical protein
VTAPEAAAAAALAASVKGHAPSSTVGGCEAA